MAMTSKALRSALTKTATKPARGSKRDMRPKEPLPGIKLVRIGDTDYYLRFYVKYGDDMVKGGKTLWRPYDRLDPAICAEAGFPEDTMPDLVGANVYYRPSGEKIEGAFNVYLAYGHLDVWGAAWPELAEARDKAEAAVLKALKAAGKAASTDDDDEGEDVAASAQ